MACYRGGCHSPAVAMKALMNLYGLLCVLMSNCIAKENGQHGCTMHFYRFADEFKKIEKTFELIDVISSRDLCRLMSPPDRPNMYSYGVGCHSLTFVMKAYMNLYNSLCVGMSDYIAKESSQNGCNMHFYRFALKFKKIRKRLWINWCHILSRSMSLDVAPR